jgi:hypothetical protein
MSTSKNDITGDSLTSRTATQQYRDNYDRIFGNRKIKNSDISGVFVPEVQEDGTMKTSSLMEWLDKNPAPVFVHADGSSSNHEPRDDSLMSSINIPSSTPDNSTPIPADDLNLELYNNNTVIADRVSTKNDMKSSHDFRMNPKEDALNQVYFSDRNIPLVYFGPLLDHPIITVQNYWKWYNIYVIMPDGVIRRITDQEIYKATDGYTNAWYIDHYFHPRLLTELAKMLNGKVCPQSLEMAAGRWVMEQVEDPFKFIDPAKHEMPKADNLDTFYEPKIIDNDTSKVKDQSVPDPELSNAYIKSSILSNHLKHLYTEVMPVLSMSSEAGDLSPLVKDELSDLEAYSFKKELAKNSPPPFINPDQ